MGNKLFRSFLSLFLALLFMLPISSSSLASREVYSRSYGYILNDDGTAVIVSYTGDASKLDIPAEIDGHAVTGIGKKAIVSRFSLISVSIPEGVTSIGDYAFWNCTALTAISIPASVSSISETAFSGCNHLAQMHVSEDNPVYKLIDGAL